MPRASIPGAVPLREPIDQRSLMLLATAPRPFATPGWGWEVKLDGFRMLAFRQGKQTRLLTRGGNDVGARFPEVIDALAAIGTDCVLDGELTVPDERGRPDWAAVRRRCAMTRPTAIKAAASARPATLYLFDLLALGKRDLRPAILAARRAALLVLVTPGPHLRVNDLWDNGIALMRAAIDIELEGVVGKRLDSPYVAGRSDYWVKVRAPTARPQTRR